MYNCSTYKYVDKVQCGMYVYNMIYLQLLKFIHLFMIDIDKGIFKLLHADRNRSIFHICKITKYSYFCLRFL